MTEPRADIEALRRDIEAFSAMNASPGEGVTRFSFSAEDRAARDYFIARAESLGLVIRIDPVGNIFARLPGINEDLPPILTGSHLDSVAHGGRFDGVVGVVCALEAVRLIRESGRGNIHPVEIVVFVEEEGPHFGSPLTGSRCLTGVYDADKLKTLKNPAGLSFYDAAKEFGLDPDALPSGILRPGEVSAMIEVHVEQSVVLDREGIHLGIVSDIAGMRWLKIEIRGESNHAGATPMGYRRDALAPAAGIVLEVERCARDFPSTVATVGKITCRPNVPNVIPGCVEFTVDIRDTNPEGIERVHNSVINLLEKLAAEKGIEYSLEVTGSIEPTGCSPRVARALKEAAELRGISCMMMTSGALHDAAVMAAVTEIGMLFVPSVNGRSHVPEEETAIADIGRASEVLFESLMLLDSAAG